MIEMKQLKEAKDISRVKPYDDKLQDIIERDELVKAWHGTFEYWVLWFCVKGIDTSVEPPSKTLGRGSTVTGYSKINTKGLFVSADRTSGFRSYIQIEVKPSELGISKEMEERGYTQKDILTTLILGDCIIVEPLPAKRIIKVRNNNEEFTRKEFINKFDDPLNFLYNKAKDYMYHDTPLLQYVNKEQLYQELKSEIRKGAPIESLIKSIENIIKYRDYKNWGGTLEDVQEILNWLENKR